MLENRISALYVSPRLSEDKTTAKMEVYRGKGVPVDLYDRVGGKLSKIEYKESTDSKGVIYKKWQIYLDDEQAPIILQVGYASGYTRGLLNALSNIDFTKPVKIGCWAKNEFLCLGVMQKEEGLVSWKYEEMPKTKKVMVGSKEVIDDTEAIEWTKKIIDEITQSIQETKNQEIEDMMNEPENKPELEDLPWEEPKL